MVLLEQSIGRVFGVQKVSLLGFSVDNAACKIFPTYTGKHQELTCLLVLEVLLGKPLFGPGCRRAALSVLWALSGVIQLRFQVGQAVYDRAGVAIQEYFCAFLPLIIFVDPGGGVSVVQVGGTARGDLRQLLQPVAPPPLVDQHKGERQVLTEKVQEEEQDRPT
jgi:hypothetical protein